MENQEQFEMVSEEHAQYLARIAARPAEPRQTRKNAPRSAPDALRVSWGGETYALDSGAIDALERDCGPCEDENGVSLWRVLRDIHAHGARNVQFI